MKGGRGSESNGLFFQNIGYLRGRSSKACSKMAFEGTNHNCQAYACCSGDTEKDPLNTKIIILISVILVLTTLCLAFIKHNPLIATLFLNQQVLHPVSLIQSRVNSRRINSLASGVGPTAELPR